MTVNRNHFSARFRHLPPWECPTCGKGHFVTIANTEAVEETGPSKRVHSHDEWEPDWAVERFVNLMKCNFSNCGEVASVSGNTLYEEEYYQDDEGGWYPEYVRYYEVLALLPAPLPIRPISKTPELVKRPLQKAGQLLWQSPEASANHIRQAVERLLDHQKIKKLTKAGGGRLTLHARLLEFNKKDQRNGPILRAVKWIGNDGSHVGGLSREEVLDAFDMMELALTNLFDDTSNNVMKKVQAIIKAKEKGATSKSSVVPIMTSKATPMISPSVSSTKPKVK